MFFSDPQPCGCAVPPEVADKGADVPHAGYLDPNGGPSGSSPETSRNSVSAANDGTYGYMRKKKVFNA